MSYWSFLISFGVTFGFCAFVYILIGFLKRKKNKKDKNLNDDTKKD